MSNLKNLGILMRYITATIFSVTYRFCNHTRQKNFYVSIHEAGCKSNVRKGLRENRKKSKRCGVADCFICKKLRPAKNTLV